MMFLTSIKENLKPHNTIIRHFRDRYGWWFVIKNYFKIKKYEKLVIELSEKWNSRRYDMFLKGKARRNFSWTQFTTICENWKERKAMNYQNELKTLFKA